MLSVKHTNSVLILPMSILCSFANGALAADISTALPPTAALTRPSKQLSAEQLDEANARVRLANSIAEHVSQDAQSKSLAPSWRINLLASLYKLSSTQLGSIEPNATTLDQALSLANAARQTAQSSSVTAKSLGSASDNLIFTPITPCRFIDTRVTGGAISTPRDFDTELDGSSYGGAAGCALPGLGEPAFAANVTIVIGAGAAGYIGIRPYGSSNTTSFVNWPSAGAPSGLANSGIITTALNASSHSEFEVFNGGTTNPQVIMDYFGYFAAAEATALSCAFANSTPVTGTLSAGQQTYLRPPACPSGYQAVAAYCYTEDASTVSTGSGPNFCAWHNSGSASSSVYQNTWCCQVP